MKYKVSDVPASETCSPNGSPEWTKAKSLRLVVVIFLSVTLLLVLVAGVVLLGAPPHAGANDSVCLTQECITTASRVITAMNRSADPCVDFYQYACGGWMERNPVPDWAATWDRLALLRESVMRDVRELLDSGKDFNKGNPADEPDSIRKARSLYRSCMNEEELDRKGVTPLKQIFRTLNLREDPTNVGEAKHFDWIYAIAKAKRFFDINIVFGFSVTMDVRNSTRNKIVIEQISPGFPEKYLLNADKFVTELKHYRNHITLMLSAYTNGTVPDEEFANDIIQFSTQIAKAMTPRQVRKTPSHLFHEVTLEQLVSGPDSNFAWKILNWTKYLETIFEDTNIQLDFRKDTVILLDLPYMRKVADLLSRTSKTTIERFVWWNVLSRFAALSLTKFRTLAFEFSRQLFGLRAEVPRWKKCINSVNLNFGLALSFLYIRTNFDVNHRNKAVELLEDIKHAFEITVDELAWMDEVTREKTLTKLHAIRAFVGYPAWIMNATQLDNHYRNVKIVDNDYFGSFLNLVNYSVRRKLEKLRKKPDRNRWVSPATTVNAFYSATLNSVTFPAGILKPPFYGNGIPALDYASIGAIMGHEITHGFDDQGRRYDENGNLRQWWSVRTLKHYQERVGCIINQYNNYWTPDLGPLFTVDGMSTQGENLADNGGLRAAYEAYKHRKYEIVDQCLPGLPDIGPDQLFFLGFAQIWCGNSTPMALKNKLLDAVHSPNRIRVIGTLSNMKEFASAWNCPEDGPMNPRNKCVVW